MPSGGDAPTSTRGRRPKFTREQIAEEGLRQLAEVGVARFNLRTLADGLPMSVMGLYRYFADKDDLLDAMVVHALAPVAESVEGTGTRSRLEHAMRRFHDVLLDNPGLAELCASRYPGPRADDLRLRLRAITNGELGDEHASQLLRALTSFVMGIAIVTPVQAGDPREKHAAFEYGLTLLLTDVPDKGATP